jgi:MFS family permease
VCAGAFVNRLGSFVQVFLVVYLHQELGYSAAAAGAAVAVYGLGSLSSAAAGGVLADRVGFRQSIAASMFLTAAAVMAIPAIAQPWLLIPVLGLAGFATDLYRPATAALLGTLVPRGERLTVFGLYRVSIGLGYALGLAVAGFVAASSFRLVFLVDAVTSAVFGAVTAVALSERRIRRTQPGEWRVRPTAGDSVPAQRALVVRPFVLLLVASALLSFAFFQNGSTLPLHIRDSGNSLPQFGALMAIQGVTVAVLALPVMLLARRVPSTRALMTGGLLVGVGVVLTGVASSVAALAVAILIWGLGEVLWSPVAQARAADLAPAGFEGRYQGWLGLTWSSGLVLSPLLGSALYGWRPGAVWLVCGGLSALAVIIVQASTRPYRRAWIAS